MAIHFDTSLERHRHPMTGSVTRHAVCTPSNSVDMILSHIGGSDGKYTGFPRYAILTNYLWEAIAFEEMLAVAAPCSYLTPVSK